MAVSMEWKWEDQRRSTEWKEIGAGVESPGWSQEDQPRGWRVRPRSQRVTRVLSHPWQSWGRKGELVGTWEHNPG